MLMCSEMMAQDMLEATIEPSTLKETFEPADVIVNECRLHLTDDGLWLRAADPAIVATVEVHLEANAFESYRADDGVIGVNVSRLIEVAKLASNDEMVDLEISTKTNQLVVESDGLEYSLALLDTDTLRKEPEVPSELNLPAEVVMEGTYLDRGIRAAEMVSDHLRIRIEEDGDTFYLEATGDTDQTRLELDEQELSSLSAGRAESLFSLQYLEAINKSVPAEGLVTLECGEELPARIQYDIDGSGPAVTYLLAPRLQQA